MKPEKIDHVFNLKKLGSNLRKCRNVKKLTQEQLAENANISIRQLQNLEYGKTDVRVSTLSKISEALKIPLQYLLLGDDLKSQNETLSLCCELFINMNLAILVIDNEGRIINLTDKARAELVRMKLEPKNLWSLCYDKDDQEALKVHFFNMSPKEKPLKPYLVFCKCKQGLHYGFKLRFSTIRCFDDSIQGYFVFLSQQEKM